MALELDTRFAVPAAWTDINDPFPGPDEWASFFDSINDLAAQDTQGTRAARPAAGAGATGGAQGGYYWSTNGTPGGSAKSLTRSDGAAWYEIALLGARADFTAGVTIGDTVAQQTSAYAPLGVTRADAAPGAFLAFNRDSHANRPALGVEFNDSLLFGLATNTTDITPLAALRITGELDVIGADHRFGANARSASGTQIHLGSRGDAANAYLGAEGSPTTVGLILRGQGASGTIVAQPDASTTVATFAANAVTLAKATTISLALTVSAGGITAAAGDITASAGALKTVGTGGTPRLYLKATDAATDAKVWDLAPSANTLLGRVLNDAENSSATWLTVTRAAAAIASISLAGFTAVAGGLQVTGSPTGYVDELKFAGTASGATVAISAFGTGLPGMLFDHRGAAGYWKWRNGVGAANEMATLGATGTFSVAGDLQIQQTAAVRDSTSGNRILYHDSGAVYVGAIDGSRFSVVRSAGADVAVFAAAGDTRWAAQPGTTHESNRVAGTAQISGRGLAVNADSQAYAGGVTVGLSVAINRAAPAAAFANAGGPILQLFTGSTWRLNVDSIGQLASAGVTTHLGYGALGATGGVLSVYADTGAADVWLFARAQDLATYRNLDHRALASRFWDAGGVLQAQVGAEADLFSLDTSLFARWRDGSGTTNPLAQIRLATGASIRTGLADSLYFLRAS